MTDDKKQLLQQRIAVLHEKYCQQLPDKYQEIEDCWQEYQNDLTNPEHNDVFYRLIHTLKGTAATFGFNTQADICFNIQTLLLDAYENKNTLSTESIKKIQQHLIELKTNISSPADSINN